LKIFEKDYDKNENKKKLKSIKKN